MHLRRMKVDRASSDPSPNPEHAWKLLSLTNEWIRHSDAKAGVTLAFTGALGTMLFNLASDFAARSAFFDVTVVLAGVLLALTALFCGLTLTPRIKDTDADPEVINRLFFASITRHFQDRRPEYAEVLGALTNSPTELVRDLADQIHANARIATVKAEFATRAIRAALVAGVAVAIVAVIIGVTNT